MMTSKESFSERGRRPAGLGGEYGQAVRTERARRAAMEELLGKLVLADDIAKDTDARKIVTALQELRAGASRSKGSRNPRRTTVIEDELIINFYQSSPKTDVINLVLDGEDPRLVLEQLPFAFLDGVEASLPEPHHGKQGYALYDLQNGAEMSVSGLVIGRPIIRTLSLVRHTGFNPDATSVSRGGTKPRGPGPSLGHGE